MSEFMIWIFIIQFTVLTLVAMMESNWGMALYGLGGALLNVGILNM